MQHKDEKSHKRQGAASIQSTQVRKKRRTCGFMNCTTLSADRAYLGGVAFCKRHGGGKRCSIVDCGKSAQGGAKNDSKHYCIAHGGGKRCSREGCSTAASAKSHSNSPYFCVRHGGGQRCSEKNCTTHVVGKSKVKGLSFCIAHGGRPKCASEGCATPSAGKADSLGLFYCVKHGGGVRCSVADCEMHRQGPKVNGRHFCLVHGGGWQCCEPGCNTRSAQRKLGIVDAHFCISHGGGRRCSVAGCLSGAMSKGLCMRHGGGIRCQVIGCHSGARGKANSDGRYLCMYHGAIPCVSCGANVTNLDSQKQLCYACYCFQHNIVPKNIKTRETTFDKMIQDEFHDLSFSYNKSQPNLCKQTRYPDWSKDFGSHLLIVECDEHQHRHGKSYDCESKRTVQIYDNAAHRPVVFIRFNPDTYRDDRGYKVPGCFKTISDKENRRKRLKIRKKEMERRWEIIAQTIKNYVHFPENVPTKAITTIKLFYDGFNAKDKSSE